MQKYHIIYGKHACLATLKGEKRKINQIYLLHEKYDYYITEIDKQYHKLVLKVTKSQLDKLTKEESKHQGIAIKASEYNFSYYLQNLIIDTESKKSNVIILDEVQDPHNLGAILRIAFCFKIDAVIMQTKNAPDITSAVVRASAGCSEFVNIISVTNISQTISELKKNDFWIIGLDSHAEEFSIRRVIKMYEKRVFVFGSEGFGMRDLTKKSCDLFIKIPINADADSLNVSSSVSIVAYETSLKSD
jgi:23S rRNA (guanosine2251-2'-O)-methyltransferase